MQSNIRYQILYLNRLLSGFYFALTLIINENLISSRVFKQNQGLFFYTANTYTVANSKYYIIGQC